MSTRRTILQKWEIGDQEGVKGYLYYLIQQTTSDDRGHLFLGSVKAHKP
jgi:hypothetical protein